MAISERAKLVVIGSYERNSLARYARGYLCLEETLKDAAGSTGAPTVVPYFGREGMFGQPIAPPERQVVDTAGNKGARRGPDGAVERRDVDEPAATVGNERLPQGMPGDGMHADLPAPGVFRASESIAKFSRGWPAWREQLRAFVAEAEHLVH